MRGTKTPTSPLPVGERGEGISRFEVKCPFFCCDPFELGNFCRIGMDTIGRILTIPPDPTPGGDGASTVLCPFQKDWSHAKPVCIHRWDVRLNDDGVSVQRRKSVWLLWPRSVRDASTAVDWLSRRNVSVLQPISNSRRKSVHTL